MSTSMPQVKRRLDYTPSVFTITHVDLTFYLEPENTRVVCISDVSKQSQSSENTLLLDGDALTLSYIKINGDLWTDFTEEKGALVLRNVPDTFSLEIETRINPQQNSTLEGLYLSGGAYCTQCEAEGFRRITYFLDRPDVLAEYKVTIHAPQKGFPYLLSNGNNIASGTSENGYHWVTWHDPFKKPCYLFALVAGDFDLLTDTFTTRSGRPVDLHLYVDKGKKERGYHALASLKKSMAWDEQVFGLEYDLDIYMIVAVDFFNMGAMENKGLNVFNSKYVLADSASATDEDYFNIESVIAHEYFHNWTGNRVTCRDWFQLSLKEGLTVFRDQQFSADMSSPVVNRIKNVRVMREHQFAEDSSAMSHPIRPDEVMEMNNFYTVTVYDKGAEVIRMMHTLLGAEGFRKGMDLYFQRHDGQAVTCDDFVNAMEDASGVDLKQFRFWYSQSGTPVVEVTDEFDEEQGIYTLLFKQHNKPTADQNHKTHLHIPVSLERLSPDKKHSDKLELIELTEQEQRFSFNHTAKPLPVLLGNFSAPVKLMFGYSADQLLEISTSAQDSFSRWDAGQSLMSNFIHSCADSDRDGMIEVGFEQVETLIGEVLKNAHSDPALAAEMLTVPSHETLVEQTNRFDVDKLVAARTTLLERIADIHLPALRNIIANRFKDPYQYEQKQVNNRRLVNTSLALASYSKGQEQLISDAFSHADNMTDSLGALKASQGPMLSIFEELMAEFESRWRHDPLVLDKWFALHAGAHREDILSRLDLLKAHQQFTINNPNRVRALIGSFAFYNPVGFHAKNGTGYQYVTDYLLELDGINPQVASRLVTPLTQWQKLDETRQDKMRNQLARLADQKGLSKDVFEKVTKSLSYTCGD